VGTVMIFWVIFKIVNIEYIINILLDMEIYNFKCILTILSIQYLGDEQSMLQFLE
jgi:hypothetical protein